ncbi:MAG TPA: transketolase family protein [Firmicutes bacterium]|nr:transketolase family protein [Bacillota bacterium]
MWHFALRHHNPDHFRPRKGWRLVIARFAPAGAPVSIREAFGDALVELGKDNPRVVVLDADLAESTRSIKFAKEIPERFVECGIAEQNMTGIAAGLATVGYIPFVTTFCVFATKRACDQVSISVAYPKLNVKICGAYSGLFTGKTGATHQAIEDIALMRAIPNMTVLEPADAVETRLAVKYAADVPGPVYLRIARDAYPVIFSDEATQASENAGRIKLQLSDIPKAKLLVDGSDITIIALGIMAHAALEACNILFHQGVSAKVLGISCVKPIDQAGILEAASETGAVVTVENHNIIGGLGSAVAEVLGEHYPVLIKRVGVRDVFGESGPDADIARKYGLTADHIVQACREVLEAKESLRLGARPAGGAKATLEPGESREPRVLRI